VTEADLIHFVNAQAQVYHQVVEELTDGRKRTHWMWFIFPQLSSLGHNVSHTISHKDKSALEILGSPDDFKFRSCLTLFCEAASNKSDRSLFAEALKQFYNAKPDPRTLNLLPSE
jgi:uncharacterized protein (DUF1810 family)